ncbi:MAG TPA: hypothetical protein ENN25_01335 [Euryarchaeota archaeon]|nr:hypothetical protein [Euryarchaeota archaeon]
MCCLCQPELSDDELKIFESDEYLRSSLTREHIDGRRTAKPTTIKLQGRWGACFFLKNRRCSINEIKPRFCRQFPIHIHMMKRVQLNVNLSCRGVNDKGGSLKSYGRSLLQSIPEERLQNYLAESKRVSKEFETRCSKAGIFQSAERIRSVATQLLPILSEQDGIGKILGFADQEPVIRDASEDEIASLIDATAPPNDLNRMAKQSNYDQFELEEVARLPVYVDEELMWNIFQSKDGRINCMVLEENGFLELRKSLDMNEADLLPLDSSAIEEFSNYARTLIGRDQFLGYASHVCHTHEYKHDLLTVYLGVLGTQLLDLWWRASLLGRVFDQSEIDAWLALEGIRAFDMDCLDAPTIGSLI